MQNIVSSGLCSSHREHEMDNMIDMLSTLYLEPPLEIVTVW